MTVWVTDWTHWQGKPLPAQQVASEGFGMVKLKVGGATREGWTFEDPTFLASAEALLQTNMVPAAYWYLMPGRPKAQAGLLLDTLTKAGQVPEWGVYVDVEQAGLTWRDVDGFKEAWSGLTDGKQLSLYASRSFWERNISKDPPLFDVIEEARWVPEAVRKDPARPYASQQAKAIPGDWWSDGWAPAGIQFTDYALIAGKRNVAAKYLGSVEDLRFRVTGHRR